MNTNMSRNLIRMAAGPVAAAGILVGALGLASVANASAAVDSHGPHDTGAYVMHDIGGPGHGTGEQRAAQGTEVSAVAAGGNPKNVVVKGDSSSAAADGDSNTASVRGDDSTATADPGLRPPQTGDSV